jgi:site-specific DNA-methyltransferase (adenine-specific)
MGSGSTGRAAIQEGFRFAGMEMDKDYFEIAQKRVEYSYKKTYENGND